MVLSATEKENEKKTLGKGLTAHPKYDKIKEKIRKGKVIGKKKIKKNKKKVLTDRRKPAIIKIQRTNKLLTQRKDWLIMTNNKLTNKKALEIAIKAIDVSGFSTDDFKTDEIIEKLEKMLAQVEKKSGGERKPTAKQEENKRLEKIILDYLTGQTESKTVTDMMKEIPELDGMSNQKVSSLVKPLKDGELIEKEIKKGRSYFFVKKD